MSVGGGDRAALERLLGVPETAWIVERVRARISSAAGEALSGVVQLDEPSAKQRAAVVSLIGRSKRAGATLRVDLAQVEEILRRGPWPAGLADAVVTLTGPVVDRSASRENEIAAWDRARAALDSAAARFPGLIDWWESWCAAGGLKRSARSEAARSSMVPGPQVGEVLVHQLSAVLDALPAAAEPLAVFARRVVGDAHGLDDSRPLGRLAGSVVGVAFTSDEQSSTERSVRDVWASAGVVMSNVSSTVLSLGVAGSQGVSGVAGAATARALEAMREARMPVLLTLDQVRSGGVRTLRRDTLVHVCENPTVVELVATRWAPLPSMQGRVIDPVLVCTSGQPSTAVIELLEILTADGAQCRYHGDFDWAGLRIARALRSRISWQPWRFTAVDYREAASQDASSLPLVGATAEAPWDPDLATVMAREGLVIEEEAVAESLAADVLAPQPKGTW